jgi:hypothetical protein
MLWCAVFGVALVAGTAAPAAAQERKQRPQKPRREPATGKYTVKFEEIANNCQNTGMTLKRGTYALTEKKGGSLDVSLEMVPVMSGRVGADGKFRAEAKMGGTAIQGVLGKFSVAGKLEDGGLIQLVFIAEYFESSKKPLCTQSWNASGYREDKLK